MSFTTNYLGMTLRSPLLVSACPLSEDLDNIRLMEDSGAGAVVLYSLFEEQLLREQHALYFHLANASESHPEALSYVPEPDSFQTGPEGYLEHIRAAKAAVSIPIIASLNGYTPGGWTSFARQIEQAGADALELNLYYIPTDPQRPGSAVEQAYVEVVRAVRAAVTLPLAVKLSPYFSNMAHMAQQFAAAGADALVLFNRFYQPDFDLETLEVRRTVLLSTPPEMRLPLHWIALLYGRVPVDLAATTGIHTGADALKMLMAGAQVTMMASALLRYGIPHIKAIEIQMREWMTSHEYESIQQMQGSLSQQHSPDPSAFERAQYVKTVSTLPEGYPYSFQG